MCISLYILKRHNVLAAKLTSLHVNAFVYEPAGFHSIKPPTLLPPTAAFLKLNHEKEIFLVLVEDYLSEAYMVYLCVGVVVGCL